MATITQIQTHAQNYVKGNSNLLSAEEIRIAQTINNLVTTYHPWRWSIVAGTNVTTASGTQEYNLDAADQNRVHKLNEAWLVSAGTALFPLIIYDWIAVPTIGTTGQPYGISLITEARVHLYPTPGAVYTLSHRFHTSGTVFTANTESYDAPARFDETIKEGVIWKFLEFLDDGRAPDKQKSFYDLLNHQKRIDMRKQHEVRS